MSSTASSSTATTGDKPPPKKMTIQSPEISIISLPYDLLLNIIARIPRLYYPTLSLVSKTFRSVVATPDLYENRSLLHLTENCLYICLRYSHRRFPRNIDTYWFALCRKPNRTVTDGSSGHLFPQRDEMWGIVEWCDVVLSLNEPFRMFDAVVLSATV